MTSRKALRNLISRALASTGRRADRRQKRRVLAAELLESRALLASFEVTSLLDTTDPNDGLITLREAIASANATTAADTITFAPTLNGTIELTQNELEITRRLTITGNGADDTVIDAQLMSRIFNITSSAVNVSISGVTLRNGVVAGPGSQQGGAIRSAATGTLSISSSRLSGNTVNDTTGTSAYGGAVFVQNGNLTVVGSTITGNTADWGGALYANGESDIAITSSNVDGNFASNDGGAVYAGFGGQGDVTITSSTLESNISQVRGGAIRADNVTVTSGSSVRLNSATTEGGAIHADGNVTVTNSTVSENTATTHGGAIHAGGNVTVAGGSTMSSNAATGKGGAIFSVGSTEVTNSTISGNSTSGNFGNGGAIFANTGAVTISHSTLSGNTTAGDQAYGGAVYTNGGAVTISQSTLSGNSTTGSTASGGAIYARSGAVTISQSTLSGNSTAGNQSQGGAVYTISGAVTVSQSTLSGNSTAGNLAFGGAISSSSGAVSISQSTLTLNNAAQSLGGAIFSLQSPVSIRNSIIAANTDNGTAPDVHKSPDGDVDFTVANSLIGRNNGTGLTASATPDINGNLIGGDNSGAAINPLLAPLANNGGPTQTHALLATSPARNRGSNALAVDVTQPGTPALTTDQRAIPFPRIASMTVDMGAYEYFTGPLVVSTNADESDGNFSSGDLSLREAIELANLSPETNSITFAPSTNGTEFDLSLFEMSVTQTLTITGNGDANTVIDAQQTSRIFNFTAGDFTLSGVTLKNGKTTANFAGGGAIASSSSGLLTIQNSTLSGNSTEGPSADGGAIYTESGAVTISQSTLVGNSTAGSEVEGGAIFAHSGAVTISQTMLSGNSTTGSNSNGGAISARSSAVTISQSTLSGNSTAGSTARGGAIYALSGAVTISQSTLTLNNAGESVGGAIFSDSSPLTILNSIVAGNTDVSGTAPDVRKSLDGDDAFIVTNSLIGRNNGTGLDASATPDANGNLIGGNNSGAAINPLLAPLTNNGGPTQTHALLATSPAINKGSTALATGLTTDQRGNPFARIFDSTVDMGAYERQTLAASFFVVTTTSDELNYSNGVVSLREAINSANGSFGTNTITFAPSLFTSGPASIVLTSGELAITESVTINGPGQTQLSVNANQLSRVLNVIGGSQINVTLSDLTLIGGHTTSDNVSGETTHSGGGIRFDSTGTLTLTNSTVSGNTTAGSAARGGGIFTYSGAVTLTNSTVSGNNTAGSGAEGGGIYALSGAVTLTNSTVSGNTTAGSNADGGGIFAYSGAVTLTNSTVSGNTTAGSNAGGGGIFAFSGAVTLTNSTVSGNSTAGSNAGGGGIFAISGAVTLTNSTVSGNNTAGDFAEGGGIYASSGALTLTNSAVSGNATAGEFSQGGGIFASSGALTLTNSTVSGNSTTGGFAEGGGISAYSGAVTLTNSTLSGNQVTGTDSDGGGVRFNNSVVTIVNSTITGNSATGAGGGLGMFVDGRDKKLTIHNSIIAGNTAGSNPDFTAPTNPATNLEVRHSLIGRNNGTGLTASANPNSNGNLIGGATDPLKINPQLGPLANNGGPTQTHALKINSPAFNRGSNALAVDAANGNSPLTNDQRGVGFSRKQFGIVDMGAFESTVLDSPEGTTGADAFVLTYSATTTAGTVTVTVSTAGGPVTNLGTFPMNAPLTINGLGGADSVRVVVTTGADKITVTSTGLTINGARLFLTNIENRTLVGRAGDDTYRFDADAALGTWTLEEAGVGSDTIDLSLTTTVAVKLNLGLATSQVVNANLRLILGSATTFENAIGGAGADTLTGNNVGNTLTGGPGNDILKGGRGSDTLLGGLNDDTYVFENAPTTEADVVTELANQGTDTLSFAALTTGVTLSLGSTAVQPVHNNRTLKLNSGITFENANGGVANDVLLGNSSANRLSGGNGNNILLGNAGADTLISGVGRDILIGGTGLDNLNGGSGDDILIAGRTTSDTNVPNLLTLQAEWISTRPYATRIANLRAGVGSPAVSLKRTVNVLNDAGEDDSSTGGSGTDWYFRATDDAITDLFAGEVIDLL